MKSLAYVLLLGAPSMSLAAPDAGSSDAAVDSAPEAAGDAGGKATPPGTTAVTTQGANPAPKSAKTAVDLDAADAAFAAGKYADARDAYTAAVKNQPDAFALRYRLAIATEASGDHAGAERHAAHAARLDPGNPTARALAAALAHTRLQSPVSPDLKSAETALQQGRLRTAEREAAAALSSATSADAKARLHIVRGRALSALGRGEEALQAMKAAASFGFVDPRVWIALADAAETDGDRARAATLRARATSTISTPGPARQTDEQETP